MKMQKGGISGVITVWYFDDGETLSMTVMCSLTLSVCSLLVLSITCVQEMCPEMVSR